MAQIHASQSAESEREELDIVVEALARNPRLASLLRFLGEKYLHGKAGEITEYSIATEVFGRSKSTFDCSTDSIARVEVHRLRKRLKEYYETDGKEHPILISLPNRSYVPSFAGRPGIGSAAAGPSVDAREIDDSSTALVVDREDTHGSAEHGSAKHGSAEHGSAEMEIAGTLHARPNGLRRRKLLYAIAAATVVLLLIGFGAIRYVARNRFAISARATSANLPDANHSPTPASAAQVPLRLLAGYDGSPRIDSAGAYWQADRYFSGSGAFARPDVSISRTSDPMLFEHWRTGDFSYDIPLAPGPYELHLFFVASPTEDYKTQYFDISLNGQPLLNAFNISADALGTNIADEKVFKDIYPDKDGYLHLKFSMGRSEPSLNAIEILPGLPHRQLPVRLVTQQAAVTDHNGNRWHPDNYFENGTLSDLPREVNGTPDPNLYAKERYGHFTYSIPVDARGRYTLVLHFAEHYWVQDAAGSVGVGTRVFRVYCNGNTLLDNFDIIKEAGSLHALTKTFSHLRPSAEGKLDLTFEPIVNYPTVSAIEVIDESE